MRHSIVIGVLSCLLWCIQSYAQPEISGSFHNISKPGGGPVSTGDILEIRSVISIPQWTTISRLRFEEVIPTGTTYVPNSLRAITNEGASGPTIPNTGIYTDAAGDDRGTLSGGNTVHINLGDAAGNGIADTDGGNVTGGTTTPRFQNRATIVQAAYRVQVTAVTHETITLAGNFYYRTSGGADIVGPVPGRNITILPQLSCGGQGPFNLITAESNGTFGEGTTHDRGASPYSVGFGYTGVTVGTPNDGSYSITKNSSPTEYLGNTPALSDLVFGVWDIIGDHTGSPDGAGNPPAPSGNNGGYMLLVNASYAPNAIFATNVTGLSANTTYTMSFWVRNICAHCGADPVTGDANPLPGIQPNLIFEINGYDLYTTGDLPYTGQWVQKSFTFNSGPLTSANITIKNNAPGGGGNDWALDDISITTCLTILPVKLSNLKATLTGTNTVLLQWDTESEEEAGRFIVEYSADGRHFRETGSVQAKGSASAYSFVHQPQGTEKAYYRLKYYDRNNVYSYSDVVVARFLQDEKNLRILTNPSGSRPEFEMYTTRDERADIIIADMTGRRHVGFSTRLRSGTNRITLPAGKDLAPGVYIVSITAGDKFLNARLIVTR